MPHRIIAFCAVVLFGGPLCHAGWAPLANVTVGEEETEKAGPCLVVEYDIKDPNVSPASPIYVFLRFSGDGCDTWHLAPMAALRGNGFDLVTQAGRKKIVWWGATESDFPDLSFVEVRVRGIEMVRVPAGRFAMKSLPGAGRDESGKDKPNPDLPLYHIAKYETTIGMYVEYLNEMGGEGTEFNRDGPYFSR